MTRYGMAIDTVHCVGCDHCSMVCKVEHNLPDGVWWCRALTSNNGGYAEGVPSGKYPDTLSAYWFTLACQHCDDPACVAVCPTGASYKREEDGIVLVEQDKCIGCSTCLAACPYEGVRTLVKDEPSWFLDFPVGDVEAPQHIANVVEKCTFCVERLDRGERPACVDVCQSLARYFGDLDDPNSEVSQILKERSYTQLQSEQGTGPCVFFLE